jgi:hypothetical protein
MDSSNKHQHQTPDGQYQMGCVHTPIVGHVEQRWTTTNKYQTPDGQLQIGCVHTVRIYSGGLMH